MDLKRSTGQMIENGYKDLKMGQLLRQTRIRYNTRG